MRILFAALTLTACSPAAELPGTSEISEAQTTPPAASQTGPQTAADACKDIAALAVAMEEPEPFGSLRTGKAKLGGLERDGSFTTAVSPAGATCDLGKMEPLNPGSGEVYVANCLVFFTGMLEREANAEKAKAAFDAVRTDLDRCLPKGWSSRDGSQPDPNVTEVMIYESPADANTLTFAAAAVATHVALRRTWPAWDPWPVYLGGSAVIAAGVVGGAMLGLGRALGETVAVYMVLNLAFDINWHILQSAGGSVASLIGAGVLVIDHDLGFITRISDHIVVLAEGRVLAEGTPAEVRANPLVAEAYLGSQACPAAHRVTSSTRHGDAADVHRRRGLLEVEERHVERAQPVDHRTSPGRGGPRCRRAPGLPITPRSSPGAWWAARSASWATSRPSTT